MAITWNTDVNAPGCPGEIVNEDGRTVLIQTDWDYPGVASTFGWTLSRVQRCPACKSLDVELLEEDWLVLCQDPDCRCIEARACNHDGTDGTVDCPHCGLTASEFIGAARAWLSDNDGATAEDPGYFDNEEAIR